MKGIWEDSKLDPLGQAYLFKARGFWVYSG
jgi:hypothetical protein